MTRSMLGKRSRDVKDDLTLDEPQKKRATRQSAPKIFEDAAEIVSTNVPSINRKPIRAAVRKINSSKSVPAQKDECRTADASINAYEQDENVPPAEVTLTSSAVRFQNVLDKTPSTPKHRVRAFGGLLTPRTPRTQDLYRQQNVYAQAKQLFTQSAAPAKLIGRNMERTKLRNTIYHAKTSHKGGCTYISGPPGTGKSALVHEVLQEFAGDAELQISIINCVNLRAAAQVYGKIAEDLLPAVSQKSTPETQLRRLFTSKGSNATYVVMLDEIDSLVDAECETLYSIFEWALHPSTSLVLIGIANALDLTDRFLPRLKAKGLRPELLPFLPYTAQQISSIVKDKLRTLIPKDSTAAADFVPCMHPAAIQLCGKKIASQTGDLRKAFSLVRRALDQVEKEQDARQILGSPTKQALGEVVNAPTQVNSSPAMPSTRAKLMLTPEIAPRATIAHVAKLASSIFSNGTTSRLAGLNLQQKAVLCSIMGKETKRQQRDPFATPTKSTTKAPSVAELFSKYTLLCKRDDGILQPLKDTEFRDVVASLETLGLVHESTARISCLLTPTSSARNAKYSSDRLVVSSVTEKEMRESLNGPGTDLLQRLLDEI